MSSKKPQGANNRSSTTKRLPALWWETLEDECPITLEPLSSLPYPPFELGSSFFDGVALASYIVSRAIFENPLTRQALTYSDCQRLDQYIKTYHPQNEGMACCCEAFMLSQSVKVKSNHNNTEVDDARARVLRSEAAAALVHLFVYGRQGQNMPDNVAWTAAPQQQPSSFNLYDNGPTMDNSAMDGLRIIDDDEERVVQAQQSERRQVQQSFPPLINGTTNASRNQDVGVNEHLLFTVQQTAAQTLQEEYRQRILFQETQRRLIQQARARQEERNKSRMAAKVVHQQECEMQRLEQDELERARAEIEAWRNEHWDRLLRETQAVQKQADENVTDSCQPSATSVAKTAMNQVDEHSKEQAKLQELKRQAEQAAKKRAKRQRAKQRKKQEKEEERKETEKRLHEKVRLEQKAASANKCDSCGQGYLGCGFEKFGHSFCSPKCARAGVPTTSSNSK